MGGDPTLKGCAGHKLIIKAKVVGWGPVILRLGLLAWVCVVIWRLTHVPSQVQETLGIMLLGGAGLFFMGRWIRRWERTMHRECRLFSKEALNAQQSLSSPSRVKLLVSCLFLADATLPSRPLLRQRVERFLGGFVSSLGPSPMERRPWLSAISAPLWSLELARSYWTGEVPGKDWAEKGREAFSQFRDEEILELLLASILEVSALFRLHLLLWGMPAQALGRGNISRLRRSWLPFCAMEPKEIIFPPSLPKELKEALHKDPTLAKGKELCRAWLLWLGKGQGLSELLQRIASS